MNDTRQKQDRLLWSRIDEMMSQKLKPSQIAYHLDIPVSTVKRLSRLTYEELLERQTRGRVQSCKLDKYEPLVVSLLTAYPPLSASQLLEMLQVHYPDMPSVCLRSVSSYMRRIRTKYHIPTKASLIRSGARHS